MLLVEKVLMLKSADLFKEVPEQSLIDLATVMKMVSAEAGEVVFEKDAPGDSMYLLVSGSVKVHDGSHVFAELKEGDFFGELSLLDAEPRSASVTSLTDCVLLQLASGPFFEAIHHDSTMLRGILRTLCRRLRAMDARAAAGSGR